MKGIRPNNKTRCYMGLYQDSQCMSIYHERQKFGVRADEPEPVTNQRTVQKATFKNQEEPAQQQEQQEEQPTSLIDPQQPEEAEEAEEVEDVEDADEGVDEEDN